MATLLKRTINALTPPIVWGVLNKRFKKRSNWSGSYPTWDVAEQQSKGYANAQILERVASATRKVIQGEYAFERDSVLFKDHDYNWNTLACLMHVAAVTGRLNVVDFGGSLGSTYWQNRIFFENLNVWWHVVEQAHYVELGNEAFKSDKIDFHNDLQSACSTGVQVVLFSSVLGYLPDPWLIIDQVLSKEPDYVIIDLTAFAENERIAVQHVPDSIFPATIPCRIFHIEDILQKMELKYRLIVKWDCRNQPDKSFTYQGLFFRSLK